MSRYSAIKEALQLFKLDTLDDKITITVMQMIELDEREAKEALERQAKWDEEKKENE